MQKSPSISYKAALRGEDRLEEYKKEIERTCAIINWEAGRLRSGGDEQPRHPECLLIGSADLGWSLTYIDRAYFEVVKCTFMHRGQPLVEWTPEKGIKLTYPGDKIYDIPKARRNIQMLVDAVCERYVSIRSRFIELEKLANEK